MKRNETKKNSCHLQAHASDITPDQYIRLINQLDRIKETNKFIIS